MSLSRSRSGLASAVTAGLAGALVGFVAGVGLAWWGGRLPGARAAADPDLQDLEASVLARLAADPELCRRPLQVAALARGILELSGEVASRAEAFRAARLARGVPGVRTVLNRLIAPEEMEPRDELRARTARRAGGARATGNGEAP